MHEDPEARSYHMRKDVGAYSCNGMSSGHLGFPKDGSVNVNLGEQVMIS